MGETTEKIRQRIDDLTERVNQSYDSKLIRDIHYWEAKLIQRENEANKKPTQLKTLPMIYNFRLIR